MPTLSDGRVVVRALEPRDLPGIEAGIRDSAVLRWIGPQPSSAEEVVARDAERWAHGEPTFAVCRADGSFAGKIWLGFRDADRSTAYVGYWLLAEARGHGFATAAVRLITAWAFRDLGIGRVRLTTAPDNLASQRVAERNGFRRVAAPDGGDLVYELEPSSRA
jgi:RimJ/RimL family protein N-acetyltransferase